MSFITNGFSCLNEFVLPITNKFIQDSNNLSPLCSVPIKWILLYTINYFSINIQTVCYYYVFMSLYVIHILSIGLNCFNFLKLHYLFRTISQCF